jgi:hypothetical protein
MGDLVRPDACSKCGQTPLLNKAGVSQIQAHHADYAKPLEVEWICVFCHRAETPRPHGRRNAWAKITDADALAIRSARGSHTSLGRVYGLDRSQIRRIRNGKAWSHVR